MLIEGCLIIQELTQRIDNLHMLKCSTGDELTSTICESRSEQFLNLTDHCRKRSIAGKIQKREANGENAKVKAEKERRTFEP